jgi:selenocysteine-specific elongation factor
VNLATLATTDLARGQVVTSPGWLRPTKVLDVAIRTLPKARPLTHNAVATFHTGSAETVARVQVLDADEVRPGEHCWAQLRLEDPVAVAKGDLFVLRSSDETLGGGEVVDVQPPRHRRKQPSVIEALKLLQRGTPEELVAQAIGRDLLPPAEIARRSGLPADVVATALASLTATAGTIELGGHYATTAGWNRLVGQTGDALAAYHRAWPLRATMPREELKSRLGMQSRLFGLLLERLAAESVIVQTETSVRLAAHEVRFSPAQSARAQRLIAALGADPHSPPALTELVEQMGIDVEIMTALVERRQIVRLNESVAYLTGTYDELQRRIVDRIREAGAITVAEVRDLTGTSRKYALALMEHLDEQKVTRRVGDTRVLR